MTTTNEQLGTLFDTAVTEYEAKQKARRLARSQSKDSSVPTLAKAAHNKQKQPVNKIKKYNKETQ